MEHWLLPREDAVESPVTHDVTDFCSFYTLPSSILGNKNYTTLKAAYSNYNVATRTPLIQLMNDALIVSKQKGFDISRRWSAPLLSLYLPFEKCIEAITTWTCSLTISIQYLALMC